MHVLVVGFAVSRCCKITWYWNR